MDRDIEINRNDALRRQADALERIAAALEGPDRDASFGDVPQPGPVRLKEDHPLVDEDVAPRVIPGWPVGVRFEDGVPRVYNKIWSSQAGLASFGLYGQPNWTKP